MRILRAGLLVLALACGANAAGAAPSIVEVATLDGLRQGGAGTATNANVDGYASPDDGGGGEFVQIGDQSSGCTDDDGVVVVEKASPFKCWFRQFSGPVHLAWYGVKDTTVSGNNCVTAPSGCNSKLIVGKAFAAAAPSAGLGGDGGVVTDGRSILIYSGSLNIPPDQYLTCGGPPGGQRVQQAQTVTDSVPYYTLPSSIVLNTGTPAAPTGNTISVQEQAAFFNCIVRPFWYNSTVFDPLNTPIGSTRDIVNKIEHQLVGTCVTATGEGIRIHDLLVIGCDTGIELNNTPRSIFSELNIEANVPVYNHNNGGGVKLQNIAIQNFLEQFITSGGVDVRETDCPITGLSGDSSGKVQVAYATGFTDCQIAQNDTVLIFGLSSDLPTNTTGTETASNPTITAIQSSSGDRNNPDGIQDIELGDVVTDTSVGGSGCIPAHTVVQSISGNSVTMSAAASCSGSHALRFSPNASGPTALNGRFLVASAASGTATLAATSWAGPAAHVSYSAGANAITIDKSGTATGINYDTTAMGIGQYLCASNSNLTPFCTPPTGFAFSTATLSDTALTTGCGTPTVTVTSLLPLSQWPRSGLLKFTSGNPETMSYTIAGPTSITITARAKEGSTCQTHANNTVMQAAAPAVVGTLPWANALALNAKAQSTQSGQSVTLSNDVNLNGTFLGSVALNSGYHTWTANTNGGATPDGALIAKVASHSGATITLDVPYASRAEEGMTVEDLTNGHLVGITVDQTPANDTDIHLSGGAGSINGDIVRISGCGYPGLVATGVSKEPWRGNCPATGFLFNGAVGTASNYIHAHGWRVYQHLVNAQETITEEPVFDSGAGNNATADPTAYGALIEGTADKIEIADGKFAAWNGIVNLPTDQNSGMGLVNLNLAQTTTLLANGPLGKISASSLKGTDAQSGITWLDPAMTSFSTAAMGIAGSSYYFSDPATLSKQFCDRSTHFGSGECGQAIAAPTCISGCSTTVPAKGSDDRFDIATNGTATTVTVQLAGLYDTAPFCTVTNSGTTSTGAASVMTAIPTVVAGTNNPDVESYWTRVTFVSSAGTAHIYGSCH